MLTILAVVVTVVVIIIINLASLRRCALVPIELALALPPHRLSCTRDLRKVSMFPRCGPWVADSLKIISTGLETDFNFPQVDKAPISSATWQHLWLVAALAKLFFLFVPSFSFLWAAPNLSWQWDSGCGTHTNGMPLNPSDPEQGSV